MYEYDIERVDNISDQMPIINGLAESNWRLISTIFNSMGNFYLLYFERLKQQSWIGN